MKCPKCSYLGFETGDRCKNCGYDFSLMPDADIQLAEPEYDLNADLMLRDTVAESAPPTWHDEFESPRRDPPLVAKAPAMTLAAEPRPAQPGAEKAPLPLFAKDIPSDDEPLVRLPAAPRQPLAVRRNPEVPRLRSMPKDAPLMRPAPEPVFQFNEESDVAETAALDSPSPTGTPPHARQSIDVPIRGESNQRPAPPLRSSEALPSSGVGARLAAALIDHGILLSIDLVVVYFTLRMASLSMDDWRILPLAPLLAFLGMVKLAYFSAFTSVGGQTIGKMAARIRVIADDSDGLDLARAMQRAVVVLVSLVALGIGFLPALGSERRAFHDRLARTRVVALPSA